MYNRYKIVVGGIAAILTAIAILAITPFLMVVGIVAPSLKLTYPLHRTYDFWIPFVFSKKYDENDVEEFF